MRHGGTQTAATSSTASTAQRDIIRTLEIEIQDLRASRARLVEALNGSTSLVDRLRLRNQLTEIDGMRDRATAAQARAQAAEEKAQRVASEGKGHLLGCILATLMLALSVYAWWCWYNGADFKYIRQRTASQLGL